MDPICELLSSYNGRDKVVRLACYTLKLWGSAAKNDGMLTASSRLSTTRATLRLFDDLPMLKYTIEYGLGNQERDTISRILGVLGNAMDQLFLPVEKICWMSEVGMLKLSDRQLFMFDTTNTLLWVSSLYLTLIRCIRQLKETTRQRAVAMKTNKSGPLQNNMEARYWIELVTCAKLCMDVTHAVNCLPDGWLWGGKLNGVKVGAIATASSLIGIWMHFARKNFLK